MKWKKLGRIYCPADTVDWSRSHAQLPTALPLGGDRHRIFFATRDEKQRSSIASIDLDIGETIEVASHESTLHLSPGPLGCFDDHGVYPASLHREGDRVLLYYIGWNPGPRSPLFYSSIGLAVSEDGGKTFRRHGAAPLLARSEHDPCLVTSPFVMREGDRWRMWYVSGFRWEERDDTLVSYYHIKYCESVDGLQWEREGHVAIDHEEGETNIARPCVLKRDDGYHMWYSYHRGEGYRIGYATSDDGLRWHRRDDSIEWEDGSSEDWDSSARAYPWIIETDRGLVMLYNGNGFGRDGFGAAIEV